MALEKSWYWQCQLKEEKEEEEEEEEKDEEKEEEKEEIEIERLIWWLCSVHCAGYVPCSLTGSSIHYCHCTVTVLYYTVRYSNTVLCHVVSLVPPSIISSPGLLLG